MAKSKAKRGRRRRVLPAQTKGAKLDAATRVRAYAETSELARLLREHSPFATAWPDALIAAMPLLPLVRPPDPRQQWMVALSGFAAAAASAERAVVEIFATLPEQGRSWLLRHRGEKLSISSVGWG